MRNFRTVIGLLLAIGAGLILAGCQAGGGAGAGAGGPTASSSHSASSTTARTAAPKAATKTASMNGLKSYKVYNTTESLCAQTCRSESRCVNHKFTPIQKINGYVAGQCQFFGR